MTRKHLYIGIGSALALIAAIIIVYNRRQIKRKYIEAEDRLESWIKPVVGKITSKFGYRTDPKTGKPGQFHNGIDLAVPIGTAIKSPMAGIVSAINFGGVGGNELIIKHSNDFKTGYAHLTKVFVQKGDKVQQGQVIALSGNTGKSTGPHLHFTLTDPQRKKIDPHVIFT
jgi:murein DD-endopeptidase MepM/ murein hydrolase activator NlpD